MWNKATVNGILKVLAGLVTRRAEEKALFESTETGGTPIEVDTTPSPQEEVTWVESYRDGDKNVLVARNGAKVIEIITLERPNKEDLIAVLQQYPNATNFHIAPVGSTIPQENVSHFLENYNPLVAPLHQYHLLVAS